MSVVCGVQLSLGGRRTLNSLETLQECPLMDGGWGVSWDLGLRQEGVPSPICPQARVGSRVWLGV